MLSSIDARTENQHQALGGCVGWKNYALEFGAGRLLCDGCIGRYDQVEVSIHLRIAPI